MSEFERLLANNEAYRATKSHVAEADPGLHVAVVTCMDARIDVLPALGLRIGEAVIIRNAGARITDDVVRSLLLAVHSLNVDTVLVMQHTRCKLAGVTNSELRALTGADLDFLPIDDHIETLRADIAKLADLGDNVEIGMFLYDVDTGEVRPVT